jgi:tetratricopeptide (TPR) repeat protein
VTRWLLSMMLTAGLLLSQQKDQKPPEPPEEDESFKTKEYEFNPLQASKELKIGLFYMKKRSFKAAANRFDEATRWDPTNFEAFLKLGEAREKLKDPAAAKQAYAKFLELAPESKEAPLIRKKLETLK